MMPNCVNVNALKMYEGCETALCCIVPDVKIL